MYCPHCGMENPDDSKFCAGCGQDVTVVEAVDETVVVAEEAPVSEVPVQEVSEPEVVVVDEPVAEEPVAEVVEEPAAEVVEEPVAEVVPEPVAEVVPEPVVEPVQPQYVPPQPQYQQPQYQQPVYQQPVYQQPQYQQPVYQQPVYQQPVYQQPHYTQPSYAKPAPVGDSRVTAVVKRACGSPLLLIIAICYTVSLLISLLSLGNASREMYMLAEFLHDELGISRGDVSFLYDTSEGALVFSLGGIILNILMCVGLFMVFAAAAGKKNTMSTGGLTMLKVVYILRMVFICIILGIAVFAAGIFMLDVLGSSFVPDSEKTGIIVGFSVLAGITAFIICYYAAIIKSISKVQNALRVGDADHRVSGFVAVMRFLSGVFSLIYAFFNISFFGYFTGDVLLLIALPALVTTATDFMVGIQMFRYRSIVGKISVH